MTVGLSRRDDDHDYVTHPNRPHHPQPSQQKRRPSLSHPHGIASAERPAPVAPSCSSLPTDCQTLLQARQGRAHVGRWSAWRTGIGISHTPAPRRPRPVSGELDRRSVCPTPHTPIRRHPHPHCPPPAFFELEQRRVRLRHRDQSGHCTPPPPNTRSPGDAPPNQLHASSTLPVADSV